MSAKFVLFLVVISMVVLAACNTVKVQLPDNNCQVAACHANPDKFQVWILGHAIAE